MNLLATEVVNKQKRLKEAEKILFKHFLRQFKKLGYIWLAFALIVNSGQAWAQGVCLDEGLAVRAIIGEASGEGFKGMQAVGEAIRNRGTLHGVYGAKAKHVDLEPEWVWKRAEKAWEASAKSDLVKGASFWESTEFKTPYWAKDMTVTAQIGKHKFYKPKKG